jgi:hypothetical protein
MGLDRPVDRERLLLSGGRASFTALSEFLMSQLLGKEAIFLVIFGLFLISLSLFHSSGDAADGLPRRLIFRKRGAASGILQITGDGDRK